MTMELELSGYGPAAWRLSPAQVRARVEKLARMREDLYDSWWATFVDGLVRDRKVTPADVAALLDEGT